ncbi:uncharacterized protein B0H64DRAFT_461648 [Chaetomium fimeti]|uniref:Uncharacterized protein n=1 Tax=Chaetomium fimeti TaxID=1854472 RepID=A0AAE0HH50_9PEZI|nr:hypothetical protein B0H64DRAFT_461648 [Chaetomium fimeti]
MSTASRNSKTYWGNGPGNSPRTHGRTQNRRTSRLTIGNGSSSVENVDPSGMINPRTVFVRGMRIEGCGIDIHRDMKSALYHVTGSGTFEDPSVAWLQAEWGIDDEIREAQSNIARRVAKANKFRCILIRKEMHGRACTFDRYGRRNTFRGDDGILRTATTASDNHMTVWMGEHAGRILVGGHIYIIQVRDPNTGRFLPQLMNDPTNQRTKSLLQPGREMVAEEFWLVRNTWERI